MSSDLSCFNLSSNADMDGVAVVVGNVIVHWCLRIVVTYSDGDIDLAIQSLLIQFYPILLSTLLSIRINHQQLSIFDADFALAISASPLAVYLSFASVCDLCGIRTGLFKRIRSYRNVVRILGAFVPFLWTALSMIKSLSDKAFLGSSCSATNFSGWLWDTLVSLTLSLFVPGKGLAPPGLVAIPLTPFFVLLFRRRSQVWADVQPSLNGALRLRVPFTWVKCAWCTIDRRHKWCIHFLFLFVDIVWSIVIGMAAVDASTMGGYELSYGQLLSLFFILPTLASTIEFLCSSRLKSLVQLTEHGFVAEMWYFFTGKEPHPPIRDSRFPLDVVSHPEPTVGRPPDQVVVSVLSTRQPLRRATFA